MRPRPHRTTQKGLGEGEEPPLSADAPPPPEAAPPSRRGVDCPPSSRIPTAGRYSVGPRSMTREFSSPTDEPGGPARGRGTSPMPACVEDAQLTRAVLEEGRAGMVIPRRLPSRSKLELAPLGSRDAFVLSLIDEQSSLQSVLDISGLGAGELASILDRLVGLGLVALG